MAREVVRSKPRALQLGVTNIRTRSVILHAASVRTELLRLACSSLRRKELPALEARAHPTRNTPPCAVALRAFPFVDPVVLDGEHLCDVCDLLVRESERRNGSELLEDLLLNASRIKHGTFHKLDIYSKCTDRLSHTCNERLKQECFHLARLAGRL